MRLGFGISLGASQLPSGYDPAVLSLTGWYRTDYAASPWTGVASAGASGSRPMTFLGVAPSVGTAINGHNPASLNGTTQALRDLTNNVSTYISTTAYTVSFLLKPSTGLTPTTIYLNRGILTESAGNWGIVYNDNGVSVYHYDGAYKSAVKACSVGSWHHVDVVYDGTNLIVYVDGVAGTPVAAGTLSATTGTLKIGSNYNDTSRFAGDIAEIRFANNALSAGVRSSLKDYDNARYGLTL